MQTPTEQLPAWLRALYPFEPKSFTTPTGPRMSYLDEGPRSEEAVLMLHGNPTWSFFYRDIVQALSPSMRCIVPDHIGMGLSAKPPETAYEYTLASRIGDVEALIDSLGVKRVHLIVHDWGGAIGFGFATRRPEMVGRIVILNTAAFVSDKIPGRIALCRAGGFGKFLVRGLNGFAGPATWMTMHRRKLSRDEKRAYLFPYNNWENRVSVHQFVCDIPLEADHRSRATLAEIEAKLPTLSSHSKLVLWGGRDFCFNDHFYERWREVYPTVMSEYFSDVGHYILDDGGDEVRAKVVRFISAK